MSSSREKKKDRRSSSGSREKEKERGKGDRKRQSLPLDESPKLETDSAFWARPFEHGQVFMRYCDPVTGTISQEQFGNMLQDLKVTVPSTVEQTTKKLSAERQFEAGMLFEKYDVHKNGRLDKEAFQKVYDEMIQRLFSHQGFSVGKGYHLSLPEVGTQTTEAIPSAPRAGTVAPGARFPDPPRFFYESPLPQLGALPVEYGDTASELLRRDFLHLQGLLEATLAPRIEVEVNMLEEVETTKQSILKRAKEIEDATRAEIDATLKRLNKQVEERCEHAERIASKHKKILEKISRFQYLAAGPRPRDALRMEMTATAQFASSIHLDRPRREGLDDPGDPTLFNFRRQRERAQAAFLEQERFPHPTVMRDFVNLFGEFQSAAEKLVDLPYVKAGISSVHGGKPEHITTTETIEELKDLFAGSDPLPEELRSNREKALETDRIAEELKLKDQMIFTLVQEREDFERQKQAFLKQVENLSNTSAEEIRAWAKLHEDTTSQLNAKIASLQEENRRLRSLEP